MFCLRFRNILAFRARKCSFHSSKKGNCIDLPNVDWPKLKESHMNQDQYYLRMAIDLALEGMRQNAGGPFGAVVVKDGEVVGKGFNRVPSSTDPTAHAEVVAIRDACKNLDTFQLPGCTIYSSCEPCHMCLGAIYWARPDRLVYAATHQDAAEIAGFDDQFIYEEIALDPADRKLPSERMLGEEGRQPFEEWREKQDKTRY